jgi:hypothetical protein
MGMGGVAGVDMPGSLWDQLCFDVQDLIVRQVARSVSLLKLCSLAHLSPSFQAAYLTRATAKQAGLLHAGPDLLTPDNLRTFLALLHRQKTRHRLMSSPRALPLGITF